jgi:hypothetical protein
VEPGYGVDLVEDDYLFLLSAADLRMVPTSRPRPVSSVALVTVYNSTTRLNDGIFRVHWFSVVTPAQLHRSDFIFRFYVYGGTFDNPPGYLLSALMGLLDMLGLLVCFLPLFWTLWFGMEHYRLVVYREVGFIPEELLLGQGRVFSI